MVSGGYDAVTFVNDLYQHSKANLTSNAVMVPMLQVVNVLLEGDALAMLVTSEEGVKMQVLDMIFPNSVGTILIPVLKTAFVLVGDRQKC